MLDCGMACRYCSRLATINIHIALGKRVKSLTPDLVDLEPDAATVALLGRASPETGSESSLGLHRDRVGSKHRRSDFAQRGDIAVWRASGLTT